MLTKRVQFELLSCLEVILLWELQMIVGARVIWEFTGHFTAFRAELIIKRVIGALLSRMRTESTRHQFPGTSWNHHKCVQSLDELGHQLFLFLDQFLRVVESEGISKEHSLMVRSDIYEHTAEYHGSALIESSYQVWANILVLSRKL